MGDRRARPLRRRARAHVRDRAVGPLVGRDVAQPLGGEPGHVVEKGGGRHEQLPVAGPAGPFPLRTVGRDVAGVVAQAPHGRLVQRVDPVVAAREPAGASHVGVHHDPADVAGVAGARAGRRSARTGSRAWSGAVRRPRRTARPRRPRRPCRPAAARAGTGRPAAGGRWSRRRPRRDARRASARSGSRPGRSRDSRTQPLMFCPRSTTWRPGSGRVTATGTISSTRRTGGAGESTRVEYP